MANILPVSDLRNYNEVLKDFCNFCFFKCLTCPDDQFCFFNLIKLEDKNTEHTDK